MRNGSESVNRRAGLTTPYIITWLWYVALKKKEGASKPMAFHNSQKTHCVLKFMDLIDLFKNFWLMGEFMV